MGKWVTEPPTQGCGIIDQVGNALSPGIARPRNDREEKKLEEQNTLGQQVLAELQAIAMARATDYLTVRQGTLEICDWEQLSDQAAAAVASVEKTSTGLRLKFYDKLKALELLGKHIGLFDAGCAPQEKTNLLQAILSGTKEEFPESELQTLQQTADSCHDLVEQTHDP